MTREEEINQASKSYASQMCNICLDEYCKEKKLTCPQIREYEIAYSEGVKWADNNPPKDVVNLNDIWHDASEEPNIDSNIVVIDKDGRLLDIQPYDGDYDRFGLEGWERCVYLYNDIQKWAYISDLLPKGGEE